MKTIHFKVRNDLLDTELGQIFDTWSGIEYRYYKSMTKDENWCAIIRQKINNIYTRYFDKDVILNKEYMDLLKKPKLMYFDWLSGTDMDADTVTDIIDDTIDKAEKLKQRFQMEKMTLSWNEYKKVIEGFLRKCFDNCKLIGEYEDKTQIVNNYDFITEDNFYVKYINRSLDGEMRKYQKRYYERLILLGFPTYKRKQHILLDMILPGVAGLVIALLFSTALHTLRNMFMSYTTSIISISFGCLILLITSLIITFNGRKI